MGTEIDRLEVVIESEASRANQQLDQLISKLNKAASTLTGIDASGLTSLANGVQHLGTAMKSMNGVKVSDFTRIANGLNKLSSVNVQGVSDASRAINTLVANLTQIGTVSFDAQGITNIANAISKLGNKSVTNAILNIPSLTMVLSELIAEMNSLQAVTFDASGLSKLISAVSSLGKKSVAQAASNIPTLTAALSGLITQLNGIKSVTFDMTGLSTLISAISKLGGKSVANVIPNIQLLGSTLNQLMTTLSKAPNVSQNVIQMTNALANLASQGSKVNGAVNGIVNVGTAATKSSGGVSRLSNTLSVFIDKMKQTKSASRSLSQVLGSFYASFFPVIRAFKAIGKAAESSMDYIETYNYFNVAVGKVATEFSDQWQKYGYDNAEDYADSFTGRLNELTKKMSGFKVGADGVLELTTDMNLGLDPEQLMNYQANIVAVTNSVGLMGENSVNTAKALSMLAADMSSFKNVDLSTVMTNFQSGLIGQSRALYKYGIDITNATLQTYAYKYGLSTSLTEMTQADKMQLRLLAILDQSRVAWGDQANTINSVANQYRILKQQIQNVARMIGNLLMPVIQAVLPFINGLLIAIQRLLNFIGGLLGIDFSKIMDGISSGYGGDMEDLADDTDDVADNFDKANSAAEKLQRTILGFDQINKLNDNDDSSSGGSGADGGAGGIDLSNEIAAALADYEAVWNEAFKKSVNDAQAYADRICKIFNNMWKMIKSGDFEGLGEYIAGGVDFVFEKINSVFNWDKMGPGITKFVDGYCRTINSIVYNVDWKNIGKTIADGANVITGSLYLYLTGIDWIGLGSALADGLNGMINSVDWKLLGQTIGAWIMKIPKMIYGFVITLDWSAVGAGIGNTLNGVLKEFDGEVIAGGINGIVNGILTALKEFIKTVDWSDVAKVVGDVLGNLDWGALAKVGLTLAAVKIVNIFGGLLRSIIIESLKKFIKEGVLNAISAFPAMIEPLSTTIATGLGGILKSISSLLGGASLGVTLGIVIGGITAIALGIIDLWNTSETFRDNVQNMLDIIGGAFIVFKQKAWDEGLKPLWDSISEFFDSLYGIYESSGLKTIFEMVVTGIGYIATTVLSGLILAAGDFIKFLANAIQVAVDVLNAALDFVQGFFDKNKQIIDGVKQIWKGLTDFLSGIFTGDWRRSWNGIKEIFSGIWNALVGIVKSPINSVIALCEGFANAAIKAFNAIKKALNSLDIDIPSWVPGVGGKSYGLNLSMTPTITIPRFESGGFPNTGEMFLARENGITEMVGRIGNRAAVANNDQIVSSIASGVKSAFIETAMEVALAMNGSQNGNGATPMVEVTIKVDSETIYKAVKKGKEKAERRYEVVVPI